MPTTKPTRKLYYSDEELLRLLEIWKELRNPGRRREPGYIGQQLTFNRWLAGLTLEGADRALAGLAIGAAAPTSGTVERPMKTTPKTKRIAKTAESTPAPRPRGRPRGRSDNTEAIYTSVTPKQKLELERRVARRRKAEGLTESWGLANLLRELVDDYLSKPAK